MLPMDFAASYQVILVAFLGFYCCFKGSQADKVAGFAAASWLMLSLMAQDITQNYTPALWGIGVAAVVCWIVRQAMSVARDRWAKYLHDILIVSMIADLLFIISSAMGENNTITSIYQNTGAGLFICFVFWIVLHSNKARNNDKSLSKLYEHSRSRWVKY